MKFFAVLIVISTLLSAEVILGNFSQKKDPVEAVYCKKEKKLFVRNKRDHRRLVSHKYDPLEPDDIKRNSFDWGKFAYYGDFDFDGKKDIALIQDTKCCLKGFGYKVYLDKNGTFVYDKKLSKLAQCFMFEADKKHGLYSVYDSVSKSNSYYVASQLFGDPHIYKVGDSNQEHAPEENYNYDKSYQAIFNRFFALIKDVKKNKFVCRVDDPSDELSEVYWSHNKRFAYIAFWDDYLIELNLKNCKRRNIISGLEISYVIFNKASTKMIFAVNGGEIKLTNLKTLKTKVIGSIGERYIKKMYLSKSEKFVNVLTDSNKTKQIKLPR